MSAKKIFIVVALFSFVIYLATLRAYPGNLDTFQSIRNKNAYATPFESPHERSSYLTLLSLLHKGNVELDRATAFWGGVDVGVYGGKIFSLFPPGVPLVSLPFFLIGKVFGMAQAFAYTTVSIMAALNVLFICIISKRVFKLSTASSILAGLLFAFATPSWSYAITFYQHHATTLFILSSFFAAFMYEKTKKISWTVAAPLLYGSSWIFDYPNLAILFPIIIYIYLSTKDSAKKLRDRWLIAGILLLSVVSAGIYNHAVFGSWHTTSNNLSLYSANYNNITTLTERDTLLDAFNSARIPSGMYALLFAPYRGLFLFSPFYILAIITLFRHVSYRNRAITTLILVASTTLLVYSLFKYPEGGWTFGPRYMIPVMAILTPFVSLWIERSKMRFKILTAGILISLSAAIALLGALTTNMIPYITEGISSNLDYTLQKPITFLLQNRSSSLIYNELFFWLPLPAYYAAILSVILLLLYALLYRIHIDQKENL